MKWNEVKNIPLYSHRLTHRKRVTYELHDIYFRLMTIKHSISKITGAIKWAFNYYIAQSRQKSSSRVGVEIDEMWQGKPHPVEGTLGNPDGVWGPEKLLIRCSKESLHPAEWTPGLRLSSPGERERHNADCNNFGVKISQLCSVSSSLSK